MYSTVAENR